jgi:hypothetical protein
MHATKSIYQVVRRHHMRGAYQFAVLIVVASMAACSYEGDGDLTDHGFFVKNHPRYVLDLGRVDLAHRWRREYTMANLPGVRSFRFRLRLRYRDWPKSVAHAKVRLVLTNRFGGVVFDVVETLSPPGIRPSAAERAPSSTPYRAPSSHRPSSQRPGQGATGCYSRALCRMLMPPK